MSPARPLVILAVALLGFAACYVAPLKNPAPKLQVFDTAVSTEEPRRLTTWSQVLRCSLHFSFLSVFRLFNLDLVTMILPGNYLLTPHGWVRRVAALQSILSKCLLALWLGPLLQDLFVL